MESPCNRHLVESCLSPPPPPGHAQQKDARQLKRRREDALAWGPSDPSAAPTSVCSRARSAGEPGRSRRRRPPRHHSRRDARRVCALVSRMRCAEHLGPPKQRRRGRRARRQPLLWARSGRLADRGRPEVRSGGGPKVKPGSWRSRLGLGRRDPLFWRWAFSRWSGFRTSRADLAESGRIGPRRPGEPPAGTSARKRAEPRPTPLGFDRFATTRLDPSAKISQERRSTPSLARPLSGGFGNDARFVAQAAYHCAESERG